MIPVTIPAAYSTAARLQDPLATDSGITGLSRIPLPRGDSRRLVAAGDVTVFGRDSFTRNRPS
jgi:hypothetical protein